MSGSRYNSGLATNRVLEHISNVRNGDQTVKLLSNEIVVTSDFKNKADQALSLLPELQAEIAQCKADLEASKAVAADYKKTNLYIQEGIENGKLVIEDSKLVQKSGGQRKTKSKNLKNQRKENINALNIDIPKNQTKNIVRT
jgi:hypothetical protein